MSKYTTELRFICESYAGLDESVGADSIENVITNSLPSLFNFNFPIFDESYREVLERKIVMHYYTREIGFETVGRWKLALNTKLNEIMPYYNKLYESELIEFNPMYATDIKTKRDNTKVEDRNKTQNTDRTEDRTIKEERDKTDNNTRTLNTKREDTGSHNNTITDVPNETTYELHSDTPQGGLNGVDNETYLSDANKTIRSGRNVTTDVGNNDLTSEDTGTIGDARVIDENLDTNDNLVIDDNKTSTEDATTTDDYLEHVYGYSNYSPSKLLEEYRETFLNIDMMIINELSKLFMGIW